jgi:hypothetical protein
MKKNTETATVKRNSIIENAAPRSQISARESLGYASDEPAEDEGVDVLAQAKAAAEAAATKLASSANLGWSPPGGVPGAVPNSRPMFFRQAQSPLEKLRARFSENIFIDGNYDQGGVAIPKALDKDPNYALFWMRGWNGERADSRNMARKHNGPIRYVFADPEDYPELDAYHSDSVDVSKGVIRAGDLVLCKVDRKRQKMWLDKLDYDVLKQRLEMRMTARERMDAIAMDHGKDESFWIDKERDPTMEDQVGLPVYTSDEVDQ